jgi:C1A family cysteine protease
MKRLSLPPTTAIKHCRVLSLLFLLFLVAVSGFTQNSAPNTPPNSYAAPLNPEFVEYLNESAESGGTDTAVPSDEYPLGHVPSPVDFSYLAEQPAVNQVAADSLPSSYDLRTANRVTPVKDQGACQASWAFAALSSEESALMPVSAGTAIPNFSENNLKNLHGFDFGPCSGGNGLMASAYLARWAGPVKETDDPYSFNTANPSATTSNSPPGLPVQKHVQDINFYPAQVTREANIPMLKSALLADGALHTSMTWDEHAYNAANAAYYYTGSAKNNLDVTLVGWDDNFDGHRFIRPAFGNGAFLVRNNRGSSWGESGYFWVSYYDRRFASWKSVSYSYVGNGATTNYARKYEYDPLGLVTFWSGNYFANIFTAAASEPLTAVSFYIAPNQYGASTAVYYTISVYTNLPGSSPSSGTLALTNSNYFFNAGYHTIVLPSQVQLTSGQRFSVVVHLTGGISNQIPVQYAQPGYSSKATASPGQSYTSADGTTWQDTTSVDPTASVCLKAFTVAPPGNQILTVNSSNPATGAGINVSPADVNSNSNGTTSFTRTYSQNTVVQLTALGTNFSSWSGCDSVNGNACTVTMSGPKVVTANYVGYVLTVKSSNPPSGVSITANPADLNGKSSGSTPFTLAYSPNGVAILTAPPGSFYSWTGCDSVSSNLCTVAMSVSKAVTVRLTGMPRAVTLPGKVGSAATATGNGRVVPNGLQTQYRFEYGTKQTLSTYKQSAWQTLQASITESAVTGSLSGLAPKTLYYYRLVATNSAGTSRGQILGFRSGPAQKKTSSSSEDDEANSAPEASPVAAPPEIAVHTVSSSSSPSVTSRNTSSGSGTGTTSGTQLATLEVTPARNAALVVKLGDLGVGPLAYTACAGLPEGATCTYDDNDQTMTITPAANTPPGSYPVSVTFTAESEE